MVVAAFLALVSACAPSEVTPSSVQRIPSDSGNVPLDDNENNTPPPVVVTPIGTETFALGGPSQNITTRLGNSIQIMFNVTAANAPVVVNFSTSTSAIPNNLNTVTSSVNPSSISLAANQTMPVTMTLVTTHGAPSLAAGTVSLTGTSGSFSKTYDQDITIEPEVRFVLLSSANSVWDLDALGGSVALRNNLTNLKVYLVNNGSQPHQFHVDPGNYHANNQTAVGMAYMFTIPSLANVTNVGWYFHNEENSTQAQFTNTAPTQ